MAAEAQLSRGRFFGSLLRGAEVRGLTLTDYEYEPSMRVSRHRHETAYMSVVIGGGYEETLPGETRTCERGTVTFHVAGEQHADRFAGDRTRIFSIEFEPRWLERAGEAAPLLVRPAALHGGVVSSLMLHICAELTGMDDLAPLAIEGLALEALAEASRAARFANGRVAPPWLQRARAFIEDEFRERLTLATIARHAGVHPLHLVREYRRFYGTTVGSTIRARRIGLAAQRLSASDESIAAIALDAGFAHQSHFATAFKRMTGFTPAAFRRARKSKSALGSR